VFHRLFPWIALVLVAAGIALAVRREWPAVSSLDWGASWHLLLIAALGFAAAPLAQAISFWLILRLLGARPPFADAMLIWAHSYVLRYAPSGAIAVVYRVRAKERLAASRDQILTAEAYEHLAALAAGATACLLAFAAIASWPPLLGIAVAIPVLAIAVAVRPKFLGPLAQRLLRRVHVDAPLLRGRQLIAASAINVIAWLGTGAGVLVLANGLTDKPSPGLAWAMATYAVGYLIGFVVPFLPGGLGAREGALVAVLSPRYGLGAATAVSLALRVAVTIGELLAVGAIVSGFYLQHRPRTAVEAGVQGDVLDSAASIEEP
jgi:glycosyltransferase 2 family protein